MPKLDYRTFTEIDKGAHQACTSPFNRSLLPTDEQKESGNYRKGHIEVVGLPIAIENPTGSTRSGKDPNGKKWSIEMTNHYGYIENTKGADGEEIDVFVKNGLTDFNGKIYVIYQNNPDGSFDEHKVVIGADSPKDAKNIYMSNYSKDWTGLGKMVQYSIDGFKTQFLPSLKHASTEVSNMKKHNRELAAIKTPAEKFTWMKYKGVKNKILTHTKRNGDEVKARLETGGVYGYRYVTKKGVAKPVAQIVLKQDAMTYVYEILAKSFDTLVLKHSKPTVIPKALKTVDLKATEKAPATTPLEVKKTAKAQSPAVDDTGTNKPASKLPYTSPLFTSENNYMLRNVLQSAGSIFMRFVVDKSKVVHAYLHKPVNLKYLKGDDLQHEVQREFVVPLQEVFKSLLPNSGISGSFERIMNVESKRVSAAIYNDPNGNPVKDSCLKIPLGIIGSSSVKETKIVPTNSKNTDQRSVESIVAEYLKTYQGSTAYAVKTDTTVPGVRKYILSLPTKSKIKSLDPLIDELQELVESELGAAPKEVENREEENRPYFVINRSIKKVQGDTYIERTQYQKTKNGLNLVRIEYIFSENAKSTTVPKTRKSDSVTPSSKTSSDPTRPDLTNDAFWDLPEQELEAVRAARLAAGWDEKIVRDGVVWVPPKKSKPNPEKDALNNAITRKGEIEDRIEELEDEGKRVPKALLDELKDLEREVDTMRSSLLKTIPNRKLKR